ncbi:MAG: MBL fold metallo-hydrolase [Candidatus Accumulibacter sp.]|jgi:L-ascorbate metabolism protein UlaG (beta-lactamase superfamily)|nr:MBL fold metallo-hydrolase [Accumulibacter sp.]
MLTFLVVLAAVSVVSGLHVHQTVGHTPTQEELTRYERLPYFKDGQFQSPEPLTRYPERITGGGSRGWERFILPNAHVPSGDLPRIALNRASFSETPANFAAYWLGHSSLIIELEGKRILVDPVFGNAAPFPGIVRRFDDPPLPRDQIPPVNLVLITHDHYDHLEYAAMRTLRDVETRFVVPLGVGAHLRKWGIPGERIDELGWGDALSREGLTIASERTIHYAGRTYGNRNKTLWTSYAVKGEKLRVFVSGDSGYGEHFKEIGAKHGPFDLAFIEIDGWNPGWPKTHLFPKEVIQVYRDIGARAFVPVHWGVFDLARHPWSESIEILSGLAEEAGDVKLLTPVMGERLVPGENPNRAWWREAPKEER